VSFDQAFFFQFEGVEWQAVELPKDISIKLWLREKPNTDVDVIASNGNHIILLECKEINLCCFEKLKTINFAST
jgi:hypothetical protein